MSDTIFYTYMLAISFVLLGLLAYLAVMLPTTPKYYLVNIHCKPECLYEDTDWAEVIKACKQAVHN